MLHPRPRRMDDVMSFIYERGTSYFQLQHMCEVLGMSELEGQSYVDYLLSRNVITESPGPCNKSVYYLNVAKRG